MHTRTSYPEQKVQTLAMLKEGISSAPMVVLINYEGIKVEEINEIRRTFEKNGIRYLVAKNTLIKKAIENTEREGLSVHLSNMTGVVLSSEDGVNTAKLVRDLVKAREKDKKEDGFVVKGGFFDGDILDAASIAKVADLPSKEELLTMLLRTMQEGPRQVLGVIQGPARDLVNLLKNYENTLSESE
jgi:large subunit ribosomal protein L10